MKNLIVAGALSVLAGCGGPGTSRAIEVQRVRSGNLDVVLLADDGALNHGNDALTLEFRRPDGELVDVGTPKASATMPMTGMAPMLGSVFVNRTDVPGRYAVSSDLSMAGGWRVRFEWDGPQGPGNATLQATVQ